MKILSYGLSIALFSLLCFGIVESVDVNRLVYGNEVSLIIEPDTTYNGFDLAELIPLDYRIDSWDVIGYNKDKINFDTRNDVSFIRNTYYGNHWEFTEGISKPILLRYTIDTREIEGKFMSVWTHPNGFGINEDLL